MWLIRASFWVTFFGQVPGDCAAYGMSPRTSGIHMWDYKLMCGGGIETT